MNTKPVDRTLMRDHPMHTRVAVRRNSVVRLITSASVAFILSVAWAHGQEMKVGVQMTYTGVGAENAQQIDRGLELYLKLNPDKVKPYTIKLIKRDAKDPGGANARVAVQELLTQDKVDIVTGWLYSPNAIATAPLVTAEKKLAVIMNAGTAHRCGRCDGSTCDQHD